MTNDQIKEIVYNPWPGGKLPRELQRPEIEELRERGYEFNDPRDVISIFEETVAKFAGAKYAVAVDCCTHSIELAARYRLHAKQAIPRETIFIPSHTYVSVWQTLAKLGFDVQFYESEPDLAQYEQWSGVYEIHGLNIIDGAVRWQEGMYKGGLHCLSFQIKKTIPIGRGGMVLTDDKEAADWIRLAAYDGRDLTTPYDSPDHIRLKTGWHYYMEPESAARGLLLMDLVSKRGDSANWTNYPYLKTMLKL